MHNIITRSYPIKLSQEKIFDDFGRLGDYTDEREGYVSMAEHGPIKFINRTFESIDEAESYLHGERNKYSYRNFAVKYMAPPKEKSAKRKNLEERIEAAYVRYNDLCRIDYVRNRKSAFIGCPKCGSKLNKDYIRGCRCNLCGESLLSDTDKKRINNAKSKWEDLCSQLEALEKAEAKKKGEVFWLVMGEYHSQKEVYEGEFLPSYIAKKGEKI